MHDFQQIVFFFQLENFKILKATKFFFNAGLRDIPIAEMNQHIFSGHST